MSRISVEQVKHVAHLASLAITEEEAEQFQNQLEQIISFAEQLNELDTDNVNPTSHVLDIKNVMREDVVQPGFHVKKYLRMHRSTKKDISVYQALWNKEGQ